jgi:hypothetical protein
MEGKWLINGIDIWLTYGAYIFKGNYNDLLAPPMPRKRLEHEYTDADGVSVDTTTPLTYEARRFNIKVGLKATSAADFWTKYNAFFALISQAGSFSLYIADLDKTYTLLYEGVAKAEKLTPIANAAGQVVATFEVKLLEPVQATNGAAVPDLIIIENGVVTMVDNSADVFEIIDGKVYLNI